jgi:hypothetical protein
MMDATSVIEKLLTGSVKRYIISLERLLKNRSLKGVFRNEKTISGKGSGKCTDAFYRHGGGNLVYGSAASLCGRT